MNNQEREAIQKFQFWLWLIMALGVLYLFLELYKGVVAASIWKGWECLTFGIQDIEHRWALALLSFTKVFLLLLVIAELDKIQALLKQHQTSLTPQAFAIVLQQQQQTWYYIAGLFALNLMPTFAF